VLIESIKSRCVRLPSRSGERISLNAVGPAGAECVIVRARTDSGIEGLGFAPCDRAGEAVAWLIRETLTELTLGENPLEHERLFRRAQKRFEGVGFTGLIARAYAAIDIAIWDIKAKAAGLPLYRLLGGSREAASVVLGDVALLGRDAKETVQLAKPLIQQGVLGLRVAVGAGDVQQDADRVQQIRDGIGEDAWLGVAPEGRYDLGTALAMAHFYEEDVGVDRYDEPLPVNDEHGYRRLADRMETPLAAGSMLDRRDDFHRLLDRGDVRVIRPDTLRLGGITPLLKVAALAEAYPVIVSPARLPEIGVHLACGLSNVDAVEHTSLLDPIFAVPLVITDGKLKPGDVPGHGMELNRAFSASE
jgi:L-alanine-DL-glutamate epimerase-like enolase superfamily enzyme